MACRPSVRTSTRRLIACPKGKVLPTVVPGAGAGPSQQLLADCPASDLYKPPAAGLTIVLVCCEHMVAVLSQAIAHRKLSRQTSIFQPQPTIQSPKQKHREMVSQDEVRYFASSLTGLDATEPKVFRTLPVQTANPFTLSQQAPRLAQCSMAASHHALAPYVPKPRTCQEQCLLCYYIILPSYNIIAGCSSFRIAFLTLELSSSCQIS
jgi:hypothetical protein